MSPDFIYIAEITIYLFTLSAVQTHTQDNSCDDDIPSRAMPAVQVFGRAYSVSDIQPTVCGEGEYLDWSTCKPCKDGTFMTRKMVETRKYDACQKCYQPGVYEIVTVPCTKARDATIMCEDGYYRSDVPGKPCQSECARCNVCGLGPNLFLNYETVHCSGFKNTGCSLSNDAYVVRGDNVNNPTKTTEAASNSSKETSVAPSERTLLHSTSSQLNAGHSTTSPIVLFNNFFVLLTQLITKLNVSP